MEEHQVSMISTSNNLLHEKITSNQLKVVTTAGSLLTLVQQHN